jgi:hypothetical protein
VDAGALLEQRVALLVSNALLDQPAAPRAGAAP